VNHSESIPAFNTSRTKRVVVRTEGESAFHGRERDQPKQEASTESE